MEKCEKNECKDRPNGVASRASAVRCFFKHQKITASLSVPIPPSWGRMLRFGNTAKFKIDELFQVDLF